MFWHEPPQTKKPSTAISTLMFRIEVNSKELCNLLCEDHGYHATPRRSTYIGRYSCLALGQLAAAAANHEEILAAGGVEALSSSLDCDDGETVFNACYALNKLAMGEGHHDVSPSKCNLFSSLGGKPPPIVRK